MPYAKLVSAFDIMFNLLRDDTILLLAELSAMLICGQSTFTAVVSKCEAWMMYGTAENGVLEYIWEIQIKWH